MRHICNVDLANDCAHAGYSLLLVAGVIIVISVAVILQSFKPK